MTDPVQLPPRPELDEGEDGLLWADLWINIAFVLFVLVSDPATSWLLPDTRLLSEGGQEAPANVLTLHLVADSAGAPVLRESTADGIVLDEVALASHLSDALQADPGTSIILSVGPTLPAGAVLETAARLERSGASAITLAQSVTEGD